MYLSRNLFKTSSSLVKIRKKFLIRYNFEVNDSNERSLEPWNLVF